MESKCLIVRYLEFDEKNQPPPLQDRISGEEFVRTVREYRQATFDDEDEHEIKWGEDVLSSGETTQLRSVFALILYIGQLRVDLCYLIFMFSKGPPLEKTKGQALKINKLVEATQDGRDELGVTYPIVHRKPSSKYRLWCFHDAAAAHSFGLGVQVPEHLQNCPAGGFISGFVPAEIVPVFSREKLMRMPFHIIDWGSFSMGGDRGSYRPELKALFRIKERAYATALEASVTCGWDQKFVLVGDSDSCIKKVTADLGVASTDDLCGEVLEIKERYFNREFDLLFIRDSYNLGGLFTKYHSGTSSKLSLIHI